jgi:Protein of unknown function (DUF1232)
VAGLGAACGSWSTPGPAPTTAAPASARPIDLLPEFLPVIGPLDDVLVVALALRYAARSVPRPVLLDAWPADPRLLERLLGPPSSTTKTG